jgi:hypothetical protein
VKWKRFNALAAVRVAIQCCILLLIFLIPLAGCGWGDDEAPQGSATVESEIPDGIEGEIIETMDSGGYTYIVVQTDNGPVWVAGPVSDITVGEKVSLPAARAMKDFQSKSLERTFETIFFVGSFGPRGGDSADPHAAMKKAHSGVDVRSGKNNAGIPGGDYRTAVDREVVGDFEKAPGGVSVAEIYENKMELKGKIVKVRGVVVKFTPAIMGTNWIHLQDGTGGDDSFDLAVTSNGTAGVGDVITVEGVLEVDKDFGAGYRYEVIVQRATLISD